jgi:hypothetical protein
VDNGLTCKQEAWIIPVMLPIFGLSTKQFYAAVGAAGVAVVLFSLAGCDRSKTIENNPSGPAEIPFNTRISFGQGGNSEPYKSAGWSKTEEKFTWTEGTSAQLRLPVAATNDTVALKILMSALIKSPELPFQPVEVYVNDQKVAEWHVGEAAEFVAAIPHDITKLGGVLTINFKTPKATSPKALGLSADPRVLGICCLDLELSKG